PERAARADWADWAERARCRNAAGSTPAMIAPYLVFFLWLPWAVAVSAAGAGAGHGLWPWPDLYLMIWVYLFLRVPRGAGGYLMWTAGIGWDLFFGGALGLGGLVGIGLWALRSSLRLGDPVHTPLPRNLAGQSFVAGLCVALLGGLLGLLEQGFQGALRPAAELPALSGLIGGYTILLWWPLCRLTGSLARLFSWDPDWQPEEAGAR
ncbi:MAG: hypothetical protein ACREJ2_04940, partial [Planctomycetota bacterium]